MPKFYDRSLAVNYARTWAYGTNPKYGRFTNDCTNFVSQVLYAGGWPMAGTHNASDRAAADQWWFGGSLLVSASHSWAGAQNLYDYLRRSGRGRIASRIEELSPGDLVQFRSADGSHIWHSTVVTGVVPGDLLLSYHTNDNRDKAISATEIPAELWVLWKIADVIPQASKGSLRPANFSPATAARSYIRR